MKHYLMVFVILFSALSSSWIGAVVSSGVQNKGTLSEKQTTLLNEIPQHQANLSHGCSSVPSETNGIQQTDNAYCVDCFDQCQCDNSACHKMNSPLVGIHIDLLNIQDIAKIPALFVPSKLKNAPIFLDFRPPKNS